MGEDDLFFVERGGAIWACWLSGKPAVNLGPAGAVESAMKQFLDQGAGAPSTAPQAPRPVAQPPPPARHPVAPPPPPPAPPPAPERAVKERGAPRHELTILGRIFTAGGSRDVTILDLSERGCQFHAPMSQLKIGDRLTIKLGPVGPVEATLRWKRADKLGVQFNSPLYPSVLEHIRDHFDLRRR